MCKLSMFFVALSWCCWGCTSPDELSSQPQVQQLQDESIKNAEQPTKPQKAGPPAGATTNNVSKPLTTGVVTAKGNSVSGGSEVGDGPEISDKEAQSVPDSSSHPKLCKQLCQVSHKLNCGSLANCLNNCTQMLEPTTCRGELVQFLNCAAGKKNSDFECDAQLEAAAIKPGRCEQQQKVYTNCLSQAVGRTPGSY